MNEQMGFGDKVAFVWRVADALKARGISAHFALAGSHGECLEQLTEQTRGRSDISILLGLADVSQLLLAADVFFFPSIEEGNQDRQTAQ